MLFWFNDPWPDRTYIEEKRFCEIGQACGEAVRLEKQTCLSIPQRSVTTTTRRSEYFMQAQLNGPLVDKNTGGRVDDGFCYAYAFDPISFRYDYGDGECLVNVSSTEWSLHEKYRTYVQLLILTSFFLLTRLKSVVRW